MFKHYAMRLSGSNKDIFVEGVVRGMHIYTNVHEFYLAWKLQITRRWYSGCRRTTECQIDTHI